MRTQRRSRCRSEHFIARLELAHVLPDRFNVACDIGSRNTLLRFKQSRAHDAHQVRLAPHKMPHTHIDAG